MAETLISPGVLARENDQSQITSQPVQAGAAIVGPTVKGKPNIPKLVTSYSEYLANFGSTFISGSDTYTYLTSISAFNYFQNGGQSLLVTRVVSESFSPAISTEVYNALESGEINVGKNFTGSLTYTATDMVPNTYTNPASTNSGTGTSPDFTVIVDTTSSIQSIVATTSGSGLSVDDTITIASTALGGGGALVTDADALLPSITQNLNFTQSTTPGVVSDLVPTTSGTGTLMKANITMANTSMISQSNGKITLNTPLPTATIDAISSAGIAMTSVAPPGGTGCTAKFESKSSVVGNVYTIVDGGTGYAVGDILTFSAAALTADGAHGTVAGDSNFTLVQAHMQVSASAITVAVAGVGYAATNTLTFAAADLVAGAESADADLIVTLVADDLQAGTNIVWTLAAGDIDNEDTFVLETLSEGNMLNSYGSESSTGALVSGSADNFRWEIVNPDINSGVFSVVIRQGNDKTKDKSVVETFPNVSLDPNASNYIERVIGNQRINVIGATGNDPYLQTSGSFPNASRYVRVKEVFYKTPDYFDNDGNAKSEFTSSIPLAQSGAFDGAIGNIVGPNDFYYDKLSDVDTQGVSGSNYITAFKLLANKDDFKYNLITAPGLVYAGSTQAGPLNTLISNVENRGDAIVVLDLEYYSSTITNATNTAATLDSSYVAAYWPWVQVTDPDSRQLVWVPASTMIPGVYAYNDKAGEAWFAPAGINRGGLGTVRQAERKLTQANRDSLYTGKVNPIATFPGRGVVVFGQKTLQTKASALDRVNVRRLLIELKSYISQVADNLVFEQNTTATRNNFLAQVNPYLENVQQRQGLYAFKVVMDDSNNTPDVIDRNQLIGAIYLQPTKTAEFIYLDFNILPTGATFPS